LLRSLLAIILGDPDRLEALRVLVTAEPCGESWKTVAAVSTLCLDYFALSASGIDYGPRIASFIYSLAQVFLRVMVIGVSRVASWRWLLPPASGLTPVSVVVVVTALRSRTAACRSTMSLAAAFTHAFFPDGGRRVLLIELNPSPLHVAKCLTQIWIVTALEYSSYAGNAGHRSPEAPLAYGSEFGV
jgi:hypothetical protein